MSSLMERASSLGHEARTAVEMFYSSNVGGMVFSGVTHKHSRLAACVSKAVLLIPANPLIHTTLCADTPRPCAAEDTSQ